MILTMEEVSKLHQMVAKSAVSEQELAAAKRPDLMLEYTFGIMFHQLKSMAQSMVAVGIHRRDTVTTQVAQTDWEKERGALAYEMVWRPRVEPASVSLLGGPEDGRPYVIRNLWSGLTVDASTSMVLTRDPQLALAVEQQVHYRPCGWNNSEGHWILSPSGRLP